MEGAGRIVVGPDSAQLRRSLRPIEWMVLEDVALQARREDTGDFVAPTSARRVAERLGLTPGAVARVLARLRAAGLVTHARQAGPAGRFGLSVYVLGPVAGIEVVELSHPPASAGPQPAPPRPVSPHLERPHAVDAHMVEAAPPRSAVGHSAGGSLQASAVAPLAGALDDPPAEERARSAEGSPVRRGRQRAAKPVVAQLSILDDTIGSKLDTNPRR